MKRPPDDLRRAFHAETDDSAYPDVEALVTEPGWKSAAPVGSGDLT